MWMVPESTWKVVGLPGSPGPLPRAAMLRRHPPALSKLSSSMRRMSNT
jgi:hypothetical protein